MKKSLFTLAALLLALVMMSFYATEQAVKILTKFDVGSTGKNAKNEVKVSLLIAAKIEELNEKKIDKMKKKWIKKQNKKKKASTIRLSRQIKRLNKLFKCWKRCGTYQVVSAQRDFHG